MGVFLAVLSVCYGFVNYELIREINEDTHSTWKAGVNDNMKTYATLDDVMLHLVPCKAQINWQRRTEKASEAVPTSFDSRTKWNNCASIKQIRNQAECGSCWAFGCVESVTDRYCIAAQQKSNPILAAEYLISCDSGSAGCNGGSPEQAWSWVQQNGLPTTACQPYTVPTCPHSQQPCTNSKPTPPCQQRCYGSSTGNFNDRYYVSDVYNPKGGFFGSLEKLQEDMMQNGPVEFAFTVYEDFLHYKSGVYVHKTGQMLGGHAVKAIGWGVENGVDYWLISNSWTTSWGDQGYFKIKRGVNECGIEDGPVAGHAKVHPSDL